MTDEHPETIIIEATGNETESHSNYDTFLEVSGGSGNFYPGPEVHLLMRSNDGEFAQGWFPVDQLLAAIEKTRQPLGQGELSFTFKIYDHGGYEWEEEGADALG